MIDLNGLAAPMSGDGCRAELFSEKYREPLKAACAEDREIWQIYSMNFGPEAFDSTIDQLVARPSTLVFALFAARGSTAGSRT